MNDYGYRTQGYVEYWTLPTVEEFHKLINKAGNVHLCVDTCEEIIKVIKQNSKALTCISKCSFC